MNTLTAKVITGLIALMLILGLVRGTLWLGPALEEKLFPTITSSTVATISRNRESGDIVLTGTLEKSRKCNIRGFTATITDSDGIVGEKAKFKALDTKPYAPIEATLGKHEFGPWVISPHSKPDNVNDWVSIYAVIKCHPLYTSKVLIASIDLSKVKEFK